MRNERMLQKHTVIFVTRRSHTIPYSFLQKSVLWGWHPQIIAPNDLLFFNSSGLNVLQHLRWTFSKFSLANITSVKILNELYLGNNVEGCTISVML